MPRPRLLVVIALAMAPLGCPQAEEVPCFPASSAAPLDESEGGFSPTVLKWEIDKMAALVDLPDSDVPASPQFLRAQRDMRTEFWGDAAHELLSVIRGDTPDSKKTRLYAQYDFALSLFRLRYFEESKKVFRMITENSAHPRRNEAQSWIDRKVCAG